MMNAVDLEARSNHSDESGCDGASHDHHSGEERRDGACQRRCITFSLASVLFMGYACQAAFAATEQSTIYFSPTNASDLQLANYSRAPFIEWATSGAILPRILAFPLMFVAFLSDYPVDSNLLKYLWSGFCAQFKAASAAHKLRSWLTVFLYILPCTFAAIYLSYQSAAEFVDETIQRELGVNVTSSARAGVLTVGTTLMAVPQMAILPLSSLIVAGADDVHDIIHNMEAGATGSFGRAMMLMSLAKIFPVILLGLRMENLQALGGIFSFFSLVHAMLHILETCVHSDEDHSHGHGHGHGHSHSHGDCSHHHHHTDKPHGWGKIGIYVVVGLVILAAAAEFIQEYMPVNVLSDGEDQDKALLIMSAIYALLGESLVHIVHLPEDIRTVKKRIPKCSAICSCFGRGNAGSSQPLTSRPPPPPYNSRLRQSLQI